MRQAQGLQRRWGEGLSTLARLLARSPGRLQRAAEHRKDRGAGDSDSTVTREAPRVCEMTRRAC